MPSLAYVRSHSLPPLRLQGAHGLTVEVADRGRAATLVEASGLSRARMPDDLWAWLGWPAEEPLPDAH